MTKETLRNKLDESQVTIREEALNQLDNKEILSLIKLASKHNLVIDVGTGVNLDGELI